MEKELFTLGIAAFNNYEYLQEAVDSVLCQNYDKIELIISNDGSKDFNEQEITEYIVKNKRQNIVSYHVHNAEKNGGTVKNVNYMAMHAHGEYIMFMAADDALYDENVLETFVSEFRKRGDNAQILSAKVAMCGMKLDDEKQYEPQQDVVELIQSGNNQKLFSRMSYESFMPTTSTCYRMSALADTDFFDETYFIIEDASKFLKLARLDYSFGWVEDLIAARHRDGGISHGNKRNKSETYRRYRFDELLLYKNEILPHIDMIDIADREKMEDKWQYIERAYYWSFLKQEDGTIDYRDYDREICQTYVEEMIKNADTERRIAQIERRKTYIRNTLQDRGGTVSLKKKTGELILILLCFFIPGVVFRLIDVYSIYAFNSYEASVFIVVLINIAIFCLLLQNVIAICYRILWEIYLMRRRMKH